MTRERGLDPAQDGVRRLPLPADMVKVGDTVVFKSELNQEYRFVVDDVDPTWITFQTKQVVHTDRFEREPFEVVRPTAAVSTAAGDSESAVDDVESAVDDVESAVDDVESAVDDVEPVRDDSEPVRDDSDREPAGENDPASMSETN